MKLVKVRRMVHWVGALLANIGRRMLRWTKAVGSGIYYGTSLRMKILIPVFLVTLLVIGVLSWLAFDTIRSTITGIYEQRARSVAAVVSKSIQEKEYILYYSEKLDADIETLLKRYESIVGITVIGMSGRGLLIVASTDPTTVGLLVSEDEQEKFSLLREVEVFKVQLGETELLRAYHPLIMGSDLVGIISVDMSLEEQQRYLSSLSWQIGLGSLVGFLMLGTLLYTILRVIVTRPIFRLARAAQAVSQRNYEVEVSPGPSRKPGTLIRDEVAKFIEVFNLMVKVINSHEKKLREMVILDELTGVYNLAHFQEAVSQEIKKGKRYKHPTSILLLEVRDIKDLKKADRDKVLITTGNFMTKELRTVDPVFRVGETRFAALLPHTPPAGAQVATDRMKERSVDITLHSAIPFSLRIVAIGWSEEDTPEVEYVLRQVQASLEADQGY
jgi:diguanylate cyclase (GGDEF)-like protein